MAQERGSATTAMTLMLSLLLHCGTTYAATFMVGDASGWTFGVNNWTVGKSFTAGDVLEFVYNRANHNVAVVDKKGYDNCTVAIESPVFQTGDDEITLKGGENYFICGFPGHCASGVKIAINATA